MRISTRASSHKQMETDQVERLPPRQPQHHNQSEDLHGNYQHDNEDRLSQPEEPRIPNNDQPSNDNPSDTESSAPRNHRHEPRNSNPDGHQENPVIEPDFRSLQSGMLAIMRRMDYMDKRHTLHFQRWEEQQKKKEDPVYSDEDWEDKSWKEDEEDDGSDHGKSNSKVDTAHKKKPTSSGKTPRSPTGLQRRRYVSQLHNSPFSDKILNAHFPQKLNLTELTKYDGTQDPTTHLEDFDMHMAVRGLEEPIVSRIFAATLKGPALKWLHTLPVGSIHKFEDLAEAFELHFATSKRQPKSQYSLSKIKQRPGETLQSYLDRFKHAALQVRGLNEDVHVHLLVDGLDKESRLAESFLKERAKNLNDFITRSKKYLEVEQMRVANDFRRDQDRATPPRDRDYTEGRRRDSRRRGSENRNRGGKFEPRSKYEKYTALNVPRSQVWKEVATTEMKRVDRPRLSYRRSGVDQSKYCAFHDGRGHTTDECYELRDAIERFIREGKLQQYVIEHQGKGGKRKPKSRSKSPPRKFKTHEDKRKKPAEFGDEFPETEFDCNVISGAMGGGGDTMSQRRKYLREVLSVRDRPKFKEHHSGPSSSPLFFTNEELRDVVPGYQDGLVITGILVNCRVKRIFVDAGSSADILSWEAFKRMNLDQEDLKPCRTTLIGFNGEQSRPKGFIDLHFTLGTRDAFRSERVRFIVTDFISPYNVILGRPTIHSWDMLVSTKHQKLKMIGNQGTVVTVQGDQRESRQCYFDTVRVGEGGPSSQPPHSNEENPDLDVNTVELDLREEDPRPEPAGELEDLVLEDPSKTTKIGKHLPPEIRASLIDFLRKNRDVFAWKSSEVPGIDPSFCCHRLGVYPGSTPISQKKRNQGPEKRKALETHVQELLEAGFISEIQYTTWLSNVVMVKKPNGKWRVCTDYTDLNKVCPKDSYPMPNIDQLVDNSSGFQLLSFMDAYSGYNQIPMHPEDREKTAFITDQANYCYNVMPFGLKNAGATYQRMMNTVFADQIGLNVEVYIDDMIVKSLDSQHHVKDLQQTFGKLRKYKIRLNPAKCAFGVPAGKFLGFMLTNRGIEANPDKCRAVLDMEAPKNKKEVQQLTGRLAALTRFLPRSAEKALPLFRLLKKEASIEWNTKCDEAFEGIKQCLENPPVLSKPEPGETLYLYLSIGEEAISAALVREVDHSQLPVYFISKTLQNAEIRYQKLEKVAFALLTAARRLRPYFQAHHIVVRTGQPIRQVLHKPDLAGRMTNWAIELSEYDIAYEARHAIKSQALADFVRELTPTSSAPSEETNVWKIYVDGSSNTKGSGAGIIVESPEGVTIEHSLHLKFPTSNNQAEYEALIAGLQQAKENGATRVKVFTDSQLVAAQIEGSYQAKGPLMAKYLFKAKEMMAEFEEASVTHIPRGENVRADILSKLASTRSAGCHRTVIQQNLEDPLCTMAISVEADWKKPIEDYLERGILPDDAMEAKKLTREAAKYTMVEDQLYRKGLHSPMLRCLNPNEAGYVLSEVHGGVNGQHMGAKALARKTLRAGYYWPTMEADSKTLVKTCDSCQKHSRVIWAPPVDLHFISAPWPFYKWGMDILGPFKTAPGQLRWLIVAVDYFTKWIEAEPLTTISSARVQRFFEFNIITRFGAPAEIVTDNGTQFTGSGFRDLAYEFGIQHHFASVEHPQSNGQAEAANKVILDGLKKRMLEANTAWVDQLPYVLWGIRTTAQTSTQETPYRMAYGCESMIPVEIGLPSWRRRNILSQGEAANNQALAVELDLADEARVTAHCRDIATKQLIAARYNKKVRPQTFQPGTLVLRRADVGNKNAKDGKLAANWDGPYRIREALQKGAYILETLDGNLIQRTWNADKLRIYYS